MIESNKSRPSNNELNDLLTCLVPCFNEEQTLRSCITSLLEIERDDLSLDIIIIDDASTDQSVEIAKCLADQYKNVRLVQHVSNQGKGASIRTGVQLAKGDFIVVQDADLEYDPTDLLKLIAPLRAGDADVAFGSRYLRTDNRVVLHFWHSLANRVLTLLSNCMTGLDLTDMETCYKMWRRDCLQAITLKENRFGFEPEVVAKISLMKLRVVETSITYRPRNYKEGKKIGIRDGIRALYCILKYSSQRSKTILVVLAIVSLIIFSSLAACVIILFL